MDSRHAYTKEFTLRAASLALLAAAWLAPAAAIEIRAVDGTDAFPGASATGVAGSALIRLTPVAYDDGLDAPRTAGLPSARAVSNALAAQAGSLPNGAGASDWLWQWGQFIDHDLDLTDPHLPLQSFDVPVPAGDAHFDPGGFGGVEIPLFRSEHVTDGLGVRQQTNAITAFIDASNVYGSDAVRAAALRDTGGRLRASVGANGETLLPLNLAGLPNATEGGNPQDFYLAGDVRANEQIGLTAVHTLFVREHNRIAGDLGARLAAGEAALVAERDLTIATPGNGVDDAADFVYEAARRLVGAQLQHITYTEFLPVLIGADLTAAHAGFDPAADPGIANEFSTVAFRLGHTLLSPQLLRENAGGMDSVALRDAFFNPGEVYSHGVDGLLKGLSAQAAQAVDTRLVDDVRNFLFGPPGAGGFDLASLNIQRGREHGIGSLNALRTALGLGAHTDFLALTGGDAALAAAFASVYGDVDDVDAWIGGLGEPQLGASMLGETFTHIIADQFARSMAGDRLFYLNELDALALLDPDFLANATLSGVVRRNTHLYAVPDDLFRVSATYVSEPGVLGLVLAGLVFARRRVTV